MAGMDCFAALAMTVLLFIRHCEERSDEAIHGRLERHMMASALINAFNPAWRDLYRDIV